MEYDRFRANVAKNYANFKNALVVDYLGREAAGVDISGVNQFRKTGLVLTQRFVSDVQQLVSEYIAHNTNGTLVGTSRGRVVDSLHAIAAHNVTDLRARLMGGAGRTADLFNRPAGAMGLLLQKKLATPELTSMDRTGRRWKSQMLVESIARDFAYQTTITFQAATIARDLAQVVYANANHPNQGLVVSLSGQPNYPSFATIRGAIFHPNSTAELRAYVQS